MRRRRAWLALALVAAFVGVPLTPAAVGASPGPTGPGPGPATLSAPLVCNTTLRLAIQASPLNGTAPLTVHFSANVTGACGGHEVEWQFGDASEGSGATPSHIYRSAGTFHAFAKVTDDAARTASARINISVSGGSGGFAVAVSVAPTSGPAPLAVTAWANVTGANSSGIDSVAWDFGDGGNGSGSPIRHTFYAAGSFVLRATVDSNGTIRSASANVTVQNGTSPGPQPNLTLTVRPSEANAPANVTVLAFSNGAAAPYLLTICFGDGSPCVPGPSGWTGTSPASFVHTYLVPGGFAVNGTIASTNGTVLASSSAPVEISQGADLEAHWTMTRDQARAPTVVTVRAEVTGGTPPYAIQWWFGDGAVGASEPNGSTAHTYRSPGDYRAFLVVQDAGGHALNLSLGTVSVATVPSLDGLSGQVGGLPTTDALLLLAASAVAIGIVVGHRSSRRARERQIREEGEELVRELEEGP